MGSYLPFLAYLGSHDCNGAEKRSIPFWAQTSHRARLALGHW